MAQAIETPETHSIASGETDVFATVWTFERASEVRVLVRAPGGAYVEQEQGVDYDVAAGDWLNDGADVVFLPGRRPPAGSDVARLRVTPAAQATPFGDLEAFRPEASEEAFDRLTRMLQEVRARQTRALEVQPGETPPSYEKLGQAEAILAEAQAIETSKADVTGENLAPEFVENVRVLPLLGAVGAKRARPIGDKLGEVVSLADFAGEGSDQFQAAIDAVGDRGPMIHLRGGPQDDPVHYEIDAPLSHGVHKWFIDGAVTLGGDHGEFLPSDVIVQMAGTGLLFDPVYIGQAPRAGLFPFEEDFLAIGVGSSTVFRSLSSATFAVASPSGSNAAVFTSRSSDGGSIGSGYALASYVINDRTLAAHGSIHGMWLYHGIAVRKPGAGTTFGLEPGVANLGSIETRHPYYAYADGLTCCAWLASGAEIPGAQPITAYAAFVYNGASAQTGLLVTANALADRGGGYGELMAVPEKTYVSQYLSTASGAIGQMGFQLTMAVATYEAGSRITANDNGVQIASIHDARNWLLVARDGLIAGPQATPWFVANASGLSVRGGPSAANSVLIYGEAAGSGEAVILTEGSDARVSLLLAFKGGGALKLQNYPFAANDSDAASKGIEVTELYRNTSNQNALTMRVA